MNETPATGNEEAAAPVCAERPPATRAAISSQEINELPLFKYEGPVTVVGNDRQLHEALPLLEKEPILGFDTESRPAFKKGEAYPVSLIQLATAERVYVVQLGALSGLDWFSRLFATTRVHKVGVHLDYDVRKLRELREFEPRGFVELASLADEAGIRNNGLRGMSAVVLGVRISKGVQRSDWSRSRLSASQIAYAATDAWMCREIYLRLSEILKPEPTHADAPGRSAGVHGAE